MKMIDYNISYFASEFEIFDLWTALMFLIGLWAHSHLLPTFQVPLVQVKSDGQAKEWSSLGFDLRFYVGFCLTVSCVHLDLLVFGSYLDIDPSNFMLDQS